MLDTVVEDSSLGPAAPRVGPWTPWSMPWSIPLVDSPGLERD